MLLCYALCTDHIGSNQLPSAAAKREATQPPNLEVGALPRNDGLVGRRLSSASFVALLADSHAK